MTRRLGIGLLTMLAACATAAPGDLDPFPTAEEGMTRFVVRLPALDDEDSARLELIVGKELEVDCNQHRYGAALEKKTVSGWGYGYYVVPSVSGPMSTLMACPEGKKERRFVRAAIDDALVRYNSRLPVVVYLPEGFELRYRVWTAGDDTVSAGTE